MTSDRRILFASEFPLTPSARSFMNRSSIAIETAANVDLEQLEPEKFDLIIIDAEQSSRSIAEICDSASRRGHRLLVLSEKMPEPALLESVEAFLVAPYSQTELISAIGDILGTELRRALRLGVSLKARLKRRSDEIAESTILQLSENGCLLDVETSITVGEQVELSFVLPSNREELSLSGTIVSGNELQLLYGVRFDGGLESERLAILVFVELGLAAGESEGPGKATDAR